MLDDPAVTHHSDFVGEMSGHREVVSDKEKSHSEGRLELKEKIGNLCLNGAVESGERFVEDEDFGVERESARDRQPLALRNMRVRLFVCG